jgi:basic amino acid/polyamine antiporter, APA family
LNNIPKKQLSLFDSTCLIVGIIVGAGIYETAPSVAGATSHDWELFAFWIVGGLLSLAGALCYAELATAYPRAGGDYVYLGRAYGPWAGFLFGWVQLVIVRPGDIALMAFIFARYAVALVAPLASDKIAADAWLEPALAGGAVVVLTAVNVVGVQQGKWTQNVLTVAKIVGLLAILLVAVLAPMPMADAAPVQPQSFDPASAALTMIFVLFTFGGWNEMAYVAAEVRDPERNIVRALVLGTVSVTVLYLMVNGAFLYALGHSGMAASKAIAADTVKTMFPVVGSRLVSALVCISALGAVNGLIFAGARISYAVGAEHRLFRPLGRWNPRTGTPIAALVVQAIIAVALITSLGSFKQTILFTAVAVYAFYMGTSLAVIVLRRKEPDVPRPYKVTGYPLTPLIFAGSCAALIWGIFFIGNYTPTVAVVSGGILLAGLPAYWISRRWTG